MRRDDFELRPIMESDLEMVLSWRNSERVRSYMYTDHLISLQEHRAWFERVSKEAFPTVLIFEYMGRPVGLKSFTQIDTRNNRCHWGFYLGDTELPRGSGSVMGLMALEFIFEEHGFHKVCAEAFAFNEGSIKYHERLGFVKEGCFARHVLKNGIYQDIVLFGCFKDEWLAGKDRLEKRIFGQGDE
ncbi:MAG: UDP-4-amino-4,6-dideoxy-N-acetyl-beta-L-altrosamine N-acetyltransferase [Desulfuromonadaceae bacterium]|nr:UDP-4-amino-4,6-dideoxy-N-acetyl-beta-L-altrosamine N-acetyltransferase [Desulfuromonadaceae bacterium]